MIKNLVYPFMTEDKYYYANPLHFEFFQRSDQLMFNTPNRFCISVDYGTVNPCSMGLWLLHGCTWYRVDEYYFDSRKEGYQKTDEEHYQSLCNLAKTYPIYFVIVDPSAASFIEVIKRHKKFNVIPARNNLKQDLRDTYYMLLTGRIKICKSCTNAKREFSLYELDDNFKPIKRYDHAMDDIRFFVSTMFRTIGVNKMCEYCRCIGNNHHYQCPNAIQSEPISKCSVCGEAIYSGDTVYKFNDDETVHADCLERLTPEEVFDFMFADISVSFNNQDIDAETFCKAFDVWAEEA